MAEKAQETVVAPKVNTTSSMKSINKEKSNAQLTAEIKAAKEKLTKGKMVAVSIPSVLQNHFGSHAFVQVNGSYVNIPVDGEEYSIPEPLANVLKESLRNLK